MKIVIERVTNETSEVRDLVRELEDVLGANYEAHQRHGLSIAQLFEPHVRFFLGTVGWPCSELRGCCSVRRLR